MDFRKTHAGGGYGSEFESDAEEEKKKRLRQDLAIKDSHSRVTGGLPSKRVAANEYDREESKNQRFHFLALDAYNRHKQLVNDYILYYPGATKDLFQRDTSKDKTDLDVIRENHRFLWSAEEAQAEEEDWGKRLAKKYWDKLFKEYCIADLSRYKENKIAMRWRVEKEVVEGKGHFTCGNKRCGEQSGLRTWEVNFGYVEHGEKKNALVKLRLCERCSYKLNYTRKCKEVTRIPPKSKVSKDRDTDSSSPKRHKSKHKVKDCDIVKHKDSDKVKHKDTDKGRHKDNDKVHSDRKVRHKDSHKRRHKDKHKKRDGDNDDDDDDDNRESRKRKRHHHKEKRHGKSRSRRSASSSRSEENSDDEDREGLSSSTHASGDDPEKAPVSEGDFWTGPAPVVEEKSREDEMDDFLNDIFL